MIFYILSGCVCLCLCLCVCVCVCVYCYERVNVIRVTLRSLSELSWWRVDALSLTLFTGAPNHQCGLLVLPAGISMGLKKQQVDIQGNGKMTVWCFQHSLWYFINLTEVSSSWFVQRVLQFFYCATRWCHNTISAPTIILFTCVQPLNNSLINVWNIEEMPVVLIKPAGWERMRMLDFTPLSVKP